MRKILISILIVLLLVLAYFTIFQGISIGSFQVLSTSGIVNLNDELTTKIEEVNRKIKNEYQSKQTELSQSVSTLLENKESYYRVANVSTESEINEANTEETYNIEYLWLRVGRHARNEGVNLKMDVINGSDPDTTIKDLSFTVVGQYVGIIDFVSSLEDDSELSFTIENFNLLPTQEGNNLQATFNVTGVRINIENTTQTVDETTSSDNTTTEGTSATDTNTVDTTAQGEQTNTETTTDTDSVS